MGVNEIIQDILDTAWNAINEISPPSNVLARLNILGGYMKEEALKTHSEAILGADVALYDTAFADGGAGKISQEEMDAAVAQAKADGQAEGEKIGFDKGVASVPVASDDGQFTKEEMEKYAASQVEQALAALPADVTPYSQEDMDKVTAELTNTKVELEKVTSDDASDKAAIAAGQSKIDAVLAILAPVPKLPVGEV